MRVSIVLGLALASVVATGAFANGGNNPFFEEEWTTPFGMPPFDRIKTEHFLPAIEAGIAEKKAEIEAIASNAEAPTFANTIEAIDRAGVLLTRVRGVAENLLGSLTSDELQAVAREAAPKITALDDDVYLDERLFARVTAVWEARDQLGLSQEQSRLLERTYLRFVRAGAKLEDEAKARLRAINEELSLLGLSFSENLLKATNAYQLVIDNQADLSGLPESLRVAGAEAAAEAGLEGKWAFGLQWPTLWPFLTYADNRELRREIYTAYLERCSRGSAYDNTETLTKIAALRLERARLLGYKTAADYVLDDTMAKTPQAVYELLEQLWTPALAVAKKEAKDLQAMVTAQGHDLQLEPWDWRYYAEKLRKERFDLDEAELRPYFELEKVRSGAFWLVNRLYGVSFVEITNAPVYHPEVRAFEVIDADGAHLGVLLVDYYPRASKRGGAWMNSFREQYVEHGRDVRPVIVNIGNFSRPVGDQPALLSIDEVKTLFHELGHGLHGMLSRCRYQTLSGTSVARDFVELPSQIMENWVLEPELLRVYARHYKTGEVIPEQLISKIKAASRFNVGYDTVEYLAASILDMDWHTITDAGDIDPVAFERATLDRIGLISAIPVRYRSPYFAHIFSGKGDYAAGYYSYKWAEVLDADAYQAFKEHGIFDAQTAESFRRNVLARGGTEDPMELYVRFRGAKPSVEPLLERSGLR
jgi:peptidyl-dipeptidase Dcp